MIFEIAKSLNEYLEVVRKYQLNEVNNWYRGMSNSSFSLEPSLYRVKRIIGLEFSGKEINGKRYKKSDAIMKSDLAAIDKFTKYFTEKFPEKSKNYNLIDFLYIMQHYDIPTRLLDFSTHHLKALYFSVSNANANYHAATDEEIKDFEFENGYSNKGSSIHIINPKMINKHTNEFENLKDDIYNIDKIDIDTLHNLSFPICVKTNNNDERIISQDGVFMLFGKDYRSVDQYEILHKNIVKIFIPNSCRYEIKKELKEKYKISHISIYPDIKGIATEIIEEIETKYINDCKSVFVK